MLPRATCPFPEMDPFVEAGTATLGRLDTERKKRGWRIELELGHQASQFLIKFCAT